MEPQHVGDDDGPVTTASSPVDDDTATGAGPAAGSGSDPDRSEEPDAQPGSVGGKDGEPVRYEIVFDCRDRTVGGRLAARIIDVIGSAFDVVQGEEGPTWSATIAFPTPVAADRFFASDLYRQFCIEVRRSAHSSVLVVPLGSPES